MSGGGNKSLPSFHRVALVQDFKHLLKISNGHAKIGQPIIEHLMVKHFFVKHTATRTAKLGT